MVLGKIYHQKNYQEYNLFQKKCKYKILLKLLINFYKKNNEIELLNKENNKIKVGDFGINLKN